MADYHDPVLLTECLHGLAIRPDGVYADCTLGGGGHSEAILRLLGTPGRLHAFDRDAEAIAYAGIRLQPWSANLVLHASPFSALGSALTENSVDGILYDLGISSHQVDESARGFTFTGRSPLDLRMDRGESRSAQEFLREVEVQELTRVLRENSDMDRAGKLAFRMKELVDNLQEPILPEHVRSVLDSVYPDRRRDMNSLLARFLQAVRMEVNQELEEIRISLRAAVAALRSGGRLCVISYHSVEDRCVKQTAAEFEKDCLCPESLPVCMCGGKHRKLKKVERKPVLPSSAEIARNSRARSAKLRVYERV